MNDFAHLDAQTAEGRLAQVRSDEMPEESTLRPCRIVTNDVGDEDCRKIVFDVWANNAYVEGFFNTLAHAKSWAEKHGYYVETLTF